MHRNVQVNELNCCWGKQAAEDDGRGLVDTVMDLLGIDSSAIGENDNLANLGIDSMQARTLSRAKGYYTDDELGLIKRLLEEGRQVASLPGTLNPCQCMHLEC